ncbi:CAF17-like 4Fe-4S cluster assembly/insertion protein YgfZ [Bartonella sp. LJL80]
MLENQQSVYLKDRRLVAITGEDATHFLHNLITTDVENLPINALLPGALLSPQGKVLFDFLIAKTSKGYILDISTEMADAFYKRLNLYKLRSKVEIVESTESVVAVSWGTDSPGSQNDSAFIDKRFPQRQNVTRTYPIGDLPAPTINDSIEAEKAWTRLRIQYAVAESGFDFASNEVFPHDINFDQTGGLSFKKGCYVGQEVVSRMHHRATARRRLLIAKGADVLSPHASIEAGGKTVGQLGSVVDNDALALVRIDRVKSAMDADIEITANGIPMHLHIAENMNYQFPDDTAEKD